MFAESKDGSFIAMLVVTRVKQRSLAKSAAAALTLRSFLQSCPTASIACQMKNANLRYTLATLNIRFKDPSEWPFVAFPVRWKAIGELCLCTANEAKIGVVGVSWHCFASRSGMTKDFVGLRMYHLDQDRCLPLLPCRVS